MSTQRELFEDDPPEWIDAMWQTLGSERSREVLALLAEMGRAALSAEIHTAQEDKRNASR